jgi:two-component system OmpR family response regulator
MTQETLREPARRSRSRAVEQARPLFLVVDPDVDHRAQLVEAISVCQLEVVETSSVVEADRLVARHAFSGLVLTWSARGSEDGLDLVSSLRGQDWRALIVVVAAIPKAATMLAVLRSGADFVLPGSYDVATVGAHVEAGLSRRRSGSLVQAGDLTIDIAGHQAWRAGVELSLTPIEFRLLVVLAQRIDEVVSKSSLLAECWRRHEDLHLGGSHLVEVHIAALRRKLHASGDPILHTVRSFGFVLRQ